MVGLTPSHHSFLLGEKKVHIYSVSRGVVGCVCMRSLCVCVTCVGGSTYNACVGVEHFHYCLPCGVWCDWCLWGLCETCCMSSYISLPGIAVYAGHPMWMVVRWRRPTICRNNHLQKVTSLWGIGGWVGDWASWCMSGWLNCWMGGWVGESVFKIKFKI